MKKCSYTWEEWDYRESIFEQNRCQEEIWEGSDEFCIFHDPSPKKNVDLFIQKFQEQKDSKKDKYLFIGYQFPEEYFFSGKLPKAVILKNAFFQEKVYLQNAIFESAADFSGVTFQKDAYFNECSFQGDADFSGVTFQKDAYFNKATIQHVYFDGAVFQGNSDFHFTTFKESAYFDGVNFRNASFSGAIFRKSAYFVKTIFERNLDFYPSSVNKIDLKGAQFLFKGHVTADLSKTRFHRADLENVAFIDCTWPKNIYEEAHMKGNDENLSFKKLETIYRKLKQNMQLHGNYSKAGEFYYREMKMRRKGTETKKKRLWLELYRGLAGYGEKPERTAFSSIFTILIFALLYWIFECLQYPAQNLTLLHQIKYTVYFSFVTFTTLGLGDIHPVNDWGIVLICCEAIIGAFLIALFVVVFARKMMR